jgi:hypothetical protein
MSYAACYAISGFAIIRIKDNFDRIPHKHLDLVELHFAGAVGEDFSAVGEVTLYFRSGRISVTWPRVVGWVIGYLRSSGFS